MNLIRWVGVVAIFFLAYYPVDYIVHLALLRAHYHPGRLYSYGYGAIPENLEARIMSVLDPATELVAIYWSAPRFKWLTSMLAASIMLGLGIHFSPLSNLSIIGVVYDPWPDLLQFPTIIGIVVLLGTLKEKQKVLANRFDSEIVGPVEEATEDIQR